MAAQLPPPLFPKRPCPYNSCRHRCAGPSHRQKYRRMRALPAPRPTVLRLTPSPLMPPPRLVRLFLTRAHMQCDLTCAPAPRVHTHAQRGTRSRPRTHRHTHTHTAPFRAPRPRTRPRKNPFPAPTSFSQCLLLSHSHSGCRPTPRVPCALVTTCPVYVVLSPALVCLYASPPPTCECQVHIYLSFHRFPISQTSGFTDI